MGQKQHNKKASRLETRSIYITTQYLEVIFLRQRKKKKKMVVANFVVPNAAVVFLPKVGFADMWGIPSYTPVTLNTCRAFWQIFSCSLHSKSNRFCLYAHGLLQVPAPFQFHRQDQQAQHSRIWRCVFIFTEWYLWKLLFGNNSTIQCIIYASQL